MAADPGSLLQNAHPLPSPQNVYGRALGYILATTTLSLLLTVIAMQWAGLGLHPFGLIASTGLPVFVGGPLIMWLTGQQDRLSRANARLEQMATTDYLTGVLNRRAFTDRVQALIAEAEATDAPGVGMLLLIDADRFKAINDTYGHDAGDRALCLITQMLCAETGPNDLVARAGGEEFAILLKDKSLTEGRQIARKMIARIASARFEPEGQPHPLSVSVGGARVGLSDTFANIYRRADAQLYRAKERAPGAVVIEADPAAKSDIHAA